MTSKKGLNILIPNATSPRNIGDQAMLATLVELLRISLPGASIRVHSADPELYPPNKQFSVRHTLYSLSAFESNRFFDKVSRLLQLAFVYTALQLGRTSYIRFVNRSLEELISDYIQADVIIFVGGGYLRSKPGFKQSLNFLMQLSMFAFAKLTHAKTIVSPISFGPFAYKWQEKLAASILNGLGLVTAREKFSYKSMKRNHIKNLVLSSDHALLLQKRNKKRIKSKRLVLGFTIRNWFDANKQKNFEESFVEAVKKFSINTNAKVLPIVQVNAPTYGEDDAAATNRIARKIKNQKMDVLATKKIDTLRQAFDVYSSIDLLLGMRMHSNILAAICSVPFVAVSYEHKTEGIVKQMLMDKYCIKSELVNRDNLYLLLKNANDNRDSISHQLKRSIKHIQTQEIRNWSDRFTNFGDNL